MKFINTIFLIVACMLTTAVAYAEKRYDISETYEVTVPARGTKAVGKYDKTIEAQYILTPTRVDTGKYVVKVKKIADNLYQIIDTDICVETRYCHEWASHATEVVVIFESNYGYHRGKIIF